MLPAGPINPSPCARARPYHCGHSHLRQSTMSPLSLRTRWPPAPGPPSLWPAPTSVSMRPARLGGLLPCQRCLPTLHPAPCALHFSSAPPPALLRRPLLRWTSGKKCALTYSKNAKESFFFSFVFTFWLEQKGGVAPAPCAMGLLPGARPKVFVVFC